MTPGHRAAFGPLFPPGHWQLDLSMTFFEFDIEFNER